MLLIGLPLLVIMVLLPVGVAKYQQRQFRNFHVVSPGVIYRSGQMTIPAIKKIVDDYHIKSIVTFRDTYTGSGPPPDAEEEAFSNSFGIKYLRLTPRKWDSDQGEPPVMQNVRKYVELLSDPANLPVLVHCFAGIHRTGSYCAIYRMEFEGWTNEKAIHELKHMGYGQLEAEKDVHGFLKSYQPIRKSTSGGVKVP